MVKSSLFAEWSIIQFIIVPFSGQGLNYRMVDKLAAILFVDHWKTEIQNIWYSYGFGIIMFGIQAPTVMPSFRFVYTGDLNQILDPNCNTLKHWFNVTFKFYR